MGNNNNPEIIPPDDIITVYSSASPEVKHAVSNILASGGNILVASYAGMNAKNQPLVHLNWQANQEMSVFMIAIMAQMGKQRFGEVWLNGLKNQLDQVV